MSSSPGGIRDRRVLVGLLLLVIALASAEAWFLTAAEADPYGVGTSGPITPANLPQVEALYGRAWTPMHFLAWSADGRYVALGDVGVLTVIDAWTGRTSSEWSVPGDVTALAWSPNGRTLAVGVDPTGGFREGWVFLYNSRGVPTASWRVTNATVGGIAWSSDGSRFLTSSADEYSMWSYTGTELYHRANVTTHGETASWSPDGTKIALGGIGSPAILDAATGTPLWISHSGPWCEVAWSPHGDVIAAGFDNGDVALYAPNGTVMVRTNLSGTGWMFGTSVSWNSEGTLLAVPTNGGIAILSGASFAVERTLVFPMSDFLSGAANGVTYDWNAAWSPRGDAIAATATTSHPSFRLWGVHYTALGWPLVALGLIGGLGLGLLLREDALWVLMSPDRVGLLWTRTDPRLRVGLGLFLFAVVSSVLYSYDGYALDRIYGLQALPSLGWIAVSLMLTVPIVCLAALAAVDIFHASAWPVSGPRPSGRRARRVFGYVLFPTLVAVGFAHALLGFVIAIFPTTGRTSFTALFDGTFGVVLGIGFYLSGRVVRGFPWARTRAPWWPLLLSAGASVAVLFVSIALLVLALNVFQIRPPVGEFTNYGFTVLLGFGFVPFVVAAIGLATVAASTGVPAMVRFLTGGYARVRGSATLELTTRRRILNLIVSNPGLHFRALLRTSGLGSGTLYYHLSVLDREGYLSIRREGRVKRYYPVPSVARRPVEELVTSI